MCRPPIPILDVVASMAYCLIHAARGRRCQLSRLCYQAAHFHLWRSRLCHSRLRALDAHAAFITDDSGVDAFRRAQGASTCKKKMPGLVRPRAAERPDA